MYLQLEKKNKKNIFMKTTAALGNLIVRVKIRNSTLSHYVGEKTSILMMPTIIGDIQYGPLMYSMHLTLLKINFASFFFLPRSTFKEHNTMDTKQSN